MKYEFEVYQMKVEDHLFWVAKSKSLKGCVGQGETSEEAIRELELNESEWLDTAVEYGIAIPPVLIHSDSSFSGKVSLRFSSFTHEEASKNAKILGVSLNQYINDAIVYYNGLTNGAHNAVYSSNAIESDSAVAESESSTIIDFATRAKKFNDSLDIQLSENKEEM